MITVIRQSKIRPTVLFVDDEREICQSLAAVLREYGYETDSTTNPFEAITKAEHWDYDIAVIDLVMPEMEGIQLVRKILAVDPRISCLILTAHGEVESCNRAYQAGIVRYLQKPVTAKQLNEVFQELLDSSRNTLLPLPDLEYFIQQAPSKLKTLNNGKNNNNPYDGEELQQEELSEACSYSLDAFREFAIKRYLENAARICEGNPRRIAEKAGVSLPTVYRLLALYCIPYNKRGG